MQHDNPAAVRRLRSELTMFRALWPDYEEDLCRLGIRTIADLRGRDAEALAGAWCRLAGRPPDPWLTSCFASVIRFAETGERVPWWRIMRARLSREQDAVFADAVPG